MKHSFALLLSALFATAAYTPPATAGEVIGTIDYLIVRQSDGLVYFGVVGTPTGKPACAVGSYWIVKDENSNAGKQIIALLMAANAAGQRVRVSGANTCTRWGDGEDVGSLQVMQ